VTIYFGQVPVIYLPSFTHALKHRNYYLNVGYDEKYGAWTKSGYNYDINKDHYGTLHLDGWERRGLAKGVEHNFRLGKTGAGRVYYYCLKEQEVLYDPQLASYYNEVFPLETNRTKFAGRYHMNVLSSLNELKVSVDMATDPAIEYDLTNEAPNLLYNRTTSVTLDRTTKNYSLEIYAEKSTITINWTKDIIYTRRCCPESALSLNACRSSTSGIVSSTTNINCTSKTNAPGQSATLSLCWRERITLNRTRTFP